MIIIELFILIIMITKKNYLISYTYKKSLYYYFLLFLHIIFIILLKFKDNIPYNLIIIQNYLILLSFTKYIIIINNKLNKIIYLLIYNKFNSMIYIYLTYYL